MPSIPPTIEAALVTIKTDESAVLGLTLGTHKITPGFHIPKAEAQTLHPEISFPDTDPSSTYLAICIDIDAPFPSAPFLSPILHWIQSDLHPSPSSAQSSHPSPPSAPSAPSSPSTTTTLKSPHPPLCAYAPPGPPGISSPHRYIFLLYDQPADLDREKFKGLGGPDVKLARRVRFDFEGFVREAGVGRARAGNWFVCN